MEKAIIKRIGFIDKDGLLDGWAFDCEGKPIELFAMDKDSGETLAFGYTLEELRRISDAHWGVNKGVQDGLDA